MSLALWWLQGLSDSGSGTPAWDTVMTLSHPASPGSHEGKVDFCTSTCSGGRSGHQCVGGILLLKDEATPIQICRRQGALDPAKLQNSFTYRQHYKLWNRLKITLKTTNFPGEGNGNPLQREILWTEEPAGLQVHGVAESDMILWLSMHAYLKK